MDAAAIRDSLDMQPEKLSEGEHININRVSGCDGKKMMSQRK